MDVLDHFINDGFGWYCIQCQRDLSVSEDRIATTFLREGEAEKSTPGRLGLAKWTDKTRRCLQCSTCGITEMVEKS